MRAVTPLYCFLTFVDILLRSTVFINDSISLRISLSLGSSISSEEGIVFRPVALKRCDPRPRVIERISTTVIGRAGLLVPGEKAEEDRPIRRAQTVMSALALSHLASLYLPALSAGGTEQRARKSSLGLILSIMRLSDTSRILQRVGVSRGINHRFISSAL